MSKKVTKKRKGASEFEIVSPEFESVSSGDLLKAAHTKVGSAIPASVAAELDLNDRSAAFKELALPKLPSLARENRARLQVQSPNRIYFYWSIRTNPYQALNRALGAETAGYDLVLRLLDLDTEREEIHPIEDEGTYWFHTDADRTYRAEIGFYSTTKPFVRIMYSNTVTTPRKSPSPRAAANADWRVGAHKFAEVLDVSGFEKDAFDVALAGDEVRAAEDTTHTAFREFIGNKHGSLDGISAEEIRYAMLAIASGRALEGLRWKIDAALFAILQANADRLASSKAAAALSKFFEIDEVEFDQEEFGPVVFGSSLVNFPKRFKTRTRREYSPLSSHVLGS